MYFFLSFFFSKINKSVFADVLFDSLSGGLLFSSKFHNNVFLRSNTPNSSYIRLVRGNVFSFLFVDFTVFTRFSAQISQSSIFSQRDKNLLFFDERRDTRVAIGI